VGLEVRHQPSSVRVLMVEIPATMPQTFSRIAASSTSSRAAAALLVPPTPQLGPMVLTDHGLLGGKAVAVAVGPFWLRLVLVAMAAFLVAVEAVGAVAPMTTMVVLVVRAVAAR